MKIVWSRSIGWNISYNNMRSLLKYGGHDSEVNMDYTIIEDGADCYPWREVYAWLPVKTITGRLIWREKVFKRKVWVVWGTGFHMEPEVQYATFFDLIKNDNT